MEPSFFIYYGNDSLLLEKEVSILLKKLLKKDLSYTFFSSIIDNFSDLIKIIAQEDIFGQNYIIKVRKDALLLEEIEKISHPHILVAEIHEGNINSLLKDTKNNSRYIIKEFNLPKTWEIEKIIGSKLSYKIDPLLVPHIASSLKSVLEIEKIKENMELFGVEKITLENYSQILDNKEISTFILGDSFFSSHPTLFLSQLQNYLDAGESLESLLGVTIKKVKDLLAIKNALINGESINSISAKIGVPAFILNKNKSLSQSFSLKQLENLLIKMVQIEFRIRKNFNQFNVYFIEKLFLEKTA
jgi:DNA polymerase III delta subunit